MRQMRSSGCEYRFQQMMRKKIELSHDTGMLMFNCSEREGCFKNADDVCLGRREGEQGRCETTANVAATGLGCRRAFSRKHATYTAFMLVPYNHFG